MLIHRNKQLVAVLNTIIQAESMGQTSCSILEDLTSENFNLLVSFGYAVSENAGPTQISWSKE